MDLALIYVRIRLVCHWKIKEYRKVMELQVVSEEVLPFFMVDEAFDDAFTKQRPQEIEPLYYDWFAQWCHGSKN